MRRGDNTYLDLGTQKIEKFSDTQSLHFDLKSADGKLFLDIRKWFTFDNKTEEIASRRGLMLDLDTWSFILPSIKEIVTANIKSTKENNIT